MAAEREYLDRGASVQVPMSYEEWQALGETKHHEWSEGVLYVNPPTRWHAACEIRLARLLEDVCPEGFMVYAEWGLQSPLGDFEPDLIVAPVDLPDDSHAAEDPLLVVEITSPTTRDHDWYRKRRAYALANVPWYWIVERDAVTVLELRGTAYEERQRIAAGEPADTVGPVGVRLDPGELASR